MNQPLMCIGVSMVLGLVSPLLRAQGPTGMVDKREVGTATSSRSWILMAGCPESLPAPTWRARDVRSEPAELTDYTGMDGNAWIVQLNLEEDGIEGTRHREPSRDPGPGQDLVMALNRLNGGLHRDGAKRPRRSTGTLASGGRPWRRSSDGTDRQSAVPDVTESGLPLVVSCVRESYNVAIDGGRRFWRTAARAVGMALVRSLVAPESTAQSALHDSEQADPELQPPMDRLTAAWIESVRPAAATDSAVDGPPIPGRLPLASGVSPGAREGIASPYEPAASAGGEMGCGIIGLPRPITAPGRPRTLSY